MRELLFLVALSVPAALSASGAAAAPGADAGAPGPQKVCAELVEAAKDADVARRRLADEQKAVAQERARLTALSKEIETARGELAKETARLEALVNRAEGARGSGRTPRASALPPEDAARLAKTLAAMSPDAAAQVLRKLERPLAVQALRAMRPASSGPILEKLEPALAAELLEARG